MKFLNNYKLFESIQDNISKYLDILETDKEEINYIFVDLIDSGYKIKYDMYYLDKNDTYHKERRKISKPTLVITIANNETKYVGGRFKSKNTDFLFTLHSCIDRFIKMFDDKCDIEYSIGSHPMDIEIECKFPAEEDTNKIELNNDDFLTIVKNTLDKSTPDKYFWDQNPGYAPKYRGYIRPLNSPLMAEEIYKAGNTSKDEWPSNWHECDEISDNFLENLKIELSNKLTNCQIKTFKDLTTEEKSKTKGLISSDDIFYIHNNEINKLIKLERHNEDVGIHAITVGKIFKKTVGIHIYKLLIDIELA